MIYAQPSTSFETSASGFPTGLVGTIGVRITDGQGGTTVARTTAGITEYPASSGIYNATLTAPATAGQYLIVWDTGSAQPQFGVDELTVNQSGQPDPPTLGNDLCTLSDVRAFLELPGTDTGRNTLIQSTITAISYAITRYCDREFIAANSATRTFTLPVGQRVLDLAPYELRSVTTMHLHPEEAQPETLTATQDYQLLPMPSRFGTYLKVRFSADLTTLHDSDSAKYFGYSQVSIAGAWGMTSVPTDVKQAAIIAVASAIRKDIPALDLGDIGLNEPRQLAPDRPVTYALPASALRMLGPYRRIGMA